MANFHKRNSDKKIEFSGVETKIIKTESDKLSGLIKFGPTVRHYKYIVANA